MLRYLSIASLLLLAAGKAAAQKQLFNPGYIVLAASPADTLRGEVDLYAADKARPRIQFRTAAGAVSTYSIDELAAAGDASGLSYRRCSVPVGDAQKPVLLQVLAAGKINLYLDPTASLPALYYLEKAGYGVMPLKRGQFVQVLQTSFADCPTASTTVASGGNYEYSGTALRRYVTNYNRCLAPQQAPAPATSAIAPSATASAAKEPIRWMVQAGVARVSFFYPFTTRKEAMPGPLVPTVGLLFSLPINSHLAFLTGCTYTSFRSDQTFETRTYTGNNYVQTEHYESKGMLFRWPLLARVTLRRPERVWRPYLQGGFQTSYLHKATFRKQVTYADPSVPLPSHDFTLATHGVGRGLHGEVGLVTHYGRHLLGTAFRFEQNDGYPVTGRPFVTNFDQLTLALTYYY